MSEVVSFKVRKELKEKMKKYKDVVNWAEELRKFIEKRIRELEAQENFAQILRELEKATWKVPKGFSTKSVREDRDRS